MVFSTCFYIQKTDAILVGVSALFTSFVGQGDEQGVHGLANVIGRVSLVSVSV